MTATTIAPARSIEKTEDGGWQATCTDHEVSTEFKTRKAAREAAPEAVCAQCLADKSEAQLVAAETGEPRELTRKECVDALTEAGYTGPTSYTMPVLRSIVAWVQEGSPKDADIPSGAIAAVYPEERPARRPRKTYAAALADLTALLDSGADLDAVRKFAEGAVA